MNERLVKSIEKNLVKFCPQLGSDSIAAYVAIVASCDGWGVGGDDSLTINNPRAIQSIRSQLPREFVEGVARVAAEAAPNAAARTLEHMRGLGAESWDAALGLGDSRIDPAVLAEVRKDISSMDSTWERTAAILGVPSDSLKGAL